MFGAVLGSSMFAVLFAPLSLYIACPRRSIGLNEPCIVGLPQLLLTDRRGLAYCSCTLIKTGSLLPTPGR